MLLVSFTRLKKINCLKMVSHAFFSVDKSLNDIFSLFRNVSNSIWNSFVPRSSEPEQLQQHNSHVKTHNHKLSDNNHHHNNSNSPHRHNSKCLGHNQQQWPCRQLLSQCTDYFKTSCKNALSRPHFVLA